ncbi:1-phosphofructokinase family hexose kinase [Curtobacterium herbarum]|uniref:Carbohydrate kinase PfkB domain-containing protein n=1 Tax=Curtobacterium herbarum TaxID=150122 RepID=A0ABN1ZBL0_9MICO|nr:PfkB family carbohydrate kinase [Curtobacterium herbarum]MBM7473928.1 tagatose 6-phosphate kinase [Curtobacterium herbarum]MCS6544744.1 PfkB family carbohydrate kinase [Curtobacterium herbarum]
MIVVVTPNPAVDVTYRVAEQVVGVTQRVLDVVRRPGGKGVNVARVLAAAGAATTSVLPLGGTSGAWVDTALRQGGLTTAAVPVTGDTRTTVTVVDDLAHPTMYGEPGPVVSADEWTAVTDAVRTAQRHASALVVSGSLPRGTDPGVVRPWVRGAVDAGLLVVADLSGPALLEAAAAGATVCKPNREELLDATGAPDERSGALDLLARGAGLVVVSAGSAGITAHTRDAVVTVPAVPDVHGNPTGAGDAATAGLVLALTTLTTTSGPTNPTTPTGRATTDLAPDVLRRSLVSAAAYGAAAVLRPVAGEVDLDAVDRFTTQLDRTGSPT